MAALNKHTSVSPALMQPAKNWVEEEGPKMHEALATPSRFDYQRAEFTQRQPHLDLSEAIRRYQQTAGKDALIDFSSKSKWTWNDVLEEAEKALDAYNAAAKGARGLIRRSFRGLGNIGPALNPWLEFIPQDQYLSILYGGLRLIFAAAIRISEKRTQIIEALQDMPETVDRACQMRKIFKSDQKLADLATELHYSLLDAIDSIISWLIEKARKKHIKAFFQGPQYGSVVDDQLRRVTKSVEKLRDQADILHLKQTGAAAVAVGRLQPQLDNLRQTGMDTAVQTREIRDGVGNMNEMIKELKHDEAVGLKSQTGMFKTLLDVVQKAHWSLEQQNAKIQHLTEKLAVSKERNKGHHFECYSTEPQLVELLMVDLSSTASEIQYVLAQRDMADTAPQPKALFQTRQFQHWLLGSMSDFVFVDGNAESYALEKVTPFTVLCATLSLSLHKMPEAISIHFYCGFHLPPNDSLSGPKGLLRSLIAQLLHTHENWNLGFIHCAHYYKELEHYDIGHLIDTFRNLLWQLPDGKVLFCLIDGISLFERWEWRADLSTILQNLGALAEGRPNNRPIFKLLMTNARCTRQLRQLVPPQGYLELPEGISFGDNIISERDVFAQALHTQSIAGASFNNEMEDTPHSEDEESFEEGNDSDIDDYSSWN